MASSSKQKTTWSKIQRESKLREKRAEKAARKEARRYALDNPEPTPAGEDELTDEQGTATELEEHEESALETSR